MDDELTTASAQVGDRFTVTVIADIVDPESGTVVIPQGTRGYGDVTFASRKGGFGKQGILGIVLRHMDLDGRHVALEGRYRQEGKSNDDAAAVTMFAVGILAIAVQGKTATIPKGRELKARTGEDITFTPGVVPVGAAAETAPAPIVEEPAVPVAAAATPEGSPPPSTPD